MVKAYWDKEKGEYCVDAFGETHTFGLAKYEAESYANEVNDFWMDAIL